jgi:hypothetical protein
VDVNSSTALSKAAEIRLGCTCSRNINSLLSGTAAAIAAIGLVALLLNPVSAQDSQARYSADAPPYITTPDTVDTRIGTLKFQDGAPDQETVKKVYDQIDFGRGIEAFLTGMSATSVYALRRLRTVSERASIRSAVIPMPPFSLMSAEERTLPASIYGIVCPPSRCCRGHALGVTPDHRSNALVRALCSVKPSANAISTSGASPVVRSSREPELVDQRLEGCAF